MNTRLTNFLLFVLVLLVSYGLWKQPETHRDAEKVKDAVAGVSDKAISAAAKISNKIEDQKIPEKTEKAVDNLKQDIQKTTESVKDNFEEAKRKDREEQKKTAP